MVFSNLIYLALLQNGEEGSSAGRAERVREEAQGTLKASLETGGISCNKLRQKPIILHPTAQETILDSGSKKLNKALRPLSINDKSGKEKANET